MFFPSPLRRPGRAASEATGALAGALGFALATSIQAQPSVPAALEPVVVTATREPALRDRVVADVVLIDAREIAASSADSIEDLLRRAAGAQLSRNGGPGQSAGVFLRGTASNGAVVIVDGVRFGSATLGQAALEAIPLALVERIEVMRGPGSSLYGADAVGGVIRISTRRAAMGGDGSLQWHGLARAGSRSSSEIAVGASGAGDSVDFALSASREASRGISAVSPDARFDRYNPDRDGFERTSVHASAGFEPAAGHRLGASWLDTRLNAQYDAAEFPPPTFAPDASPDFRNRVATRVVSLDYRGKVAPAWTLSLSAGAHRDDLRSGGTIVDRFVTDRRQFTWQNAFALDPEQQVVLAIDHATEAVQAATLGTVPDRRHTGVVLSWTGRADAWRWQTDLRRDRLSVGDDQTTGKLGGGWDLAGGWSVRAVVGSAFRAPTFNDLYFPGFGVPTVRSERSRSVEFGLDWSGAPAPAADGAARPSVGLTVFRNRVRDLIGFEPDPARCPPGLGFGCAANVSDARLQGVGLEWRQPVLRDAAASLDLHARLDWLQARDRGRDEPLARRAPHQQSITLSGAEGPWTLAASLLAVGARPEAGRSLDAYRIIDLRLARRVAAGWWAEASVLNAANERYAVALDYPGMPRQFWIGLRHTGGAPTR